MTDRPLIPLMVSGLLIATIGLGLFLPLVALSGISTAPTPAASPKGTAAPACASGERYVRVTNDRLVDVPAGQPGGQCIPASVIPQLEAQLRRPRPSPSLTPRPFRTPAPTLLLP